MLFAFMVFIGFVIQITAMGAPSFLAGDSMVPEAPTCVIGPPEDVPENDFWGNIWKGAFDVPVVSQAAMLMQMFGCGWNNMAFFFTLMTYSSSIAMLGAVLLVPFFVALLWMISSWLRGR